MSLFKGFFGGGKPEPKQDYAKTILAVSTNGGQGIVDSRYEDFADYLRKNASIKNEAVDYIFVKLNLGGKPYEVSLHREGAGLNQCMLRVNYNIGWESPDIGEHIARDAFAGMIKSDNDAISVAWNISTMSASDYVHETDNSFASAYNRLPPAVATLHRRIMDKDGDLLTEYQGISKVDMFRVHKMREDIMSQIPSADIRLDVGFKIAGAVLKLRGM